MEASYAIFDLRASVIGRYWVIAWARVRGG